MKCPKCNEHEAEYGRSYRTTPDYPLYLQEFTCKECGRIVASGNHREGYTYVRDGRIDDNGDDSHITGGYWIWNKKIIQTRNIINGKIVCWQLETNGQHKTSEN